MKKQNKKTWDSRPVVFLPNKLNLKQLVTEKVPFKEFNMGKAEYIISLIFEIPALNKNLHHDGFVPINARTLASVIWDYKSYLDYFIEAGVLETDGYYINGEKSRCYKVTQQYYSQVSPIIRHDRGGLNHVHLKGGVRKYAHLFKWFNEKLTIEFEEAITYLQNEFADNINKGILTLSDTVDRFNRSLVNVCKIHYGTYNVNIDDNIARLHSPLTNLRSDLRVFLRYNGQKLANIDIKNSQPYFSARLLDIEFWTATTQKFGGLGIEDRVGINNLGLRSESICVKDIVVYIMIWKNNESQYHIELQKYLNLILTGKLYEYFQPFLIQELGEEYTDRKLVKQQILMCLYSDNTYFKQPRAATKRIFEHHFPSIYNLITMIKERDKRHFSWILQRIESYALLEVATKEMAKERPEMPLFTIHDSILTTVGNQDYVSEKIRAVLTSLIGYSPTLKIELEELDSTLESKNFSSLDYTRPIELTPPFYPVSYQLERPLQPQKQVYER